MVHYASDGGKGYSVYILTPYRGTIATAIENTIAFAAWQSSAEEFPY